MIARRTIASLIGSIAVCLAVTAVAQQQAAPQPYKPMVGQSGKDVVWVPTNQKLADTMLDMAKVTASDYVIDLGSGDGVLVITAAKRGARAMGIEYNPDMVEFAKQNAKTAGVGDKATFVKADLFESDFSKANVITMFLLPSLNMKLRPTLLNLRPGTRIVSNSFGMEDWEADANITLTEGCESSWCTAFLWIVPAQVEGAWRLPEGELRLTQAFQKLSGTLGTAAIADGLMRGDEISFKVGEKRYSGQVSGGSIKGTATAANQTTPWAATRAK